MIAPRIALRVAPILRDALCTDETSRRALIILPSFIALAAASYAGAGPDRFRDVRQVARAAARGAGSTMVETFNESQMNVIDSVEAAPEEHLYSHELEPDRNAVGVASHAVDTIVLAVQADGLAERHRAWSGLGSKWTCDVLLAFYDFPAEHWKHTTNPIESTFAAVRLRTTKTKGCLSRMTALTMVFKLCQSASKKWRRRDGSHHIADIIQGVKFKDGEKLTERAA